MWDDRDSETGGLTRREVLRRGAAVGLVIGAGGLFAESGSAATAATPKRGGTLRVALTGGSASADNLDPHASSSSPELGQAFRENVYSKLTDLLPSGAYGMQLAQSMESNHAATVWHIKLKKGVTWHDGSPLTADDVIYTFRRILDPKGDYGSAASNIPMIDRNGMKKINDLELTMKLKTPWIDLPSAVGQRFVSIVKVGSKAPYTVKNTNGTGAFKLKSWTPGTKFSMVANREYFEHGKPYVDALTMIGVPDSVARVNALVSGQVDAINDVPAGQIPVIKNAGKVIFTGKAGGFIPIYMDTTAPPYNDVRVRQAMKLLMDRPKALSSAVSGYGLIANDVMARWDPLYDSALPQRHYDPDQAVSLLKAAGQDKTAFDLHTSAVQSELVPQALVLAEGAKNAGVTINVTTDPADSFWDKTYGHVPFSFSSYGYRPFFAQWLNSFAAYNSYETKWDNDASKQATKLVYKAAATFDAKKRKEIAFQAQKLLWDDGGYIVAFFKEPIDGLSPKVKGLKPYAFPFLGWYHFWDAWLA
jgi:peptide/nickel transport system substrate-binding protein